MSGTNEIQRSTASSFLVLVILAALAALGISALGCESAQVSHDVGDKTVHMVRWSDPSGPQVVSVLLSDLDGTETTYVETLSSAGWFGDAIHAAGFVGGKAVEGSSWRTLYEGDRTNVSNESDAHSRSKSKAGAAAGAAAKADAEVRAPKRGH